MGNNLTSKTHRNHTYRAYHKIESTDKMQIWNNLLDRIKSASRPAKIKLRGFIGSIFSQRKRPLQSVVIVVGVGCIY